MGGSSTTRPRQAQGRVDHAARRAGGAFSGSAGMTDRLLM
jgi:hypothetical protein